MSEPNGERVKYATRFCFLWQVNQSYLTGDDDRQVFGQPEQQCGSARARLLRRYLRSPARSSANQLFFVFMTFLTSDDCFCMADFGQRRNSDMRLITEN
jgi:hypothetical protein